MIGMQPSLGYLKDNKHSQIDFQNEKINKTTNKYPLDSKTTYHISEWILTSSFMIIAENLTTT